MRPLVVGMLAAPVVALATGVWAEFADLGPPLLLAVAMPAMAATLLSAARSMRPVARPPLLVLLGAAIGLLTFAISDGLYLAIHYARGGTLDFEAYQSQAAMAGALFGIHVAAGTVSGFVLGVVAAVLLSVANALGWRALNPAPSREVQ